MKKKIAIIGAGVAGLTFANLLKKDSKFDFTVYEKNEALSLDEGFGIQLAVNSISILNKIGFNKINSEKIFHPKKLNFYSKWNAHFRNYTPIYRKKFSELTKEIIQLL